jgi:hypothetical protein
VFVLGDVLAFMTQAAGGGIQGGKTLKSLRLGEKVLLAGLFLQVLFFGRETPNIQTMAYSNCF